MYGFTGTGPVQSFAVHAHARSNDQLADRLFDKPLQQHRGTEIIDARVLGDLIHALANANQRDKVINGIHSCQRFIDDFRIANIA